MIWRFNVKKNLYLYFSGTGNTAYVLRKFASLYEKESYDFISIEDQSKDFGQLIQQANTIIIGYPIHDSIMPFIMQDFLNEYKNFFKEKSIIVVVTQMLFSGDGGALAYRLLKKVNVNLLHSIHINMPNNISDLKFLKPKNINDTEHITKKADQKIKIIVDKINQGKQMKMGLRFYSRFLGLFLQRLFGYYFYKKMRRMVKIHHDSCVLCNKCVTECPTNSLIIENNKVIPYETCTVCYRCVNICPTQSISILSKNKPNVQYIRDQYN